MRHLSGPEPVVYVHYRDTGSAAGEHPEERSHAFERRAVSDAGWHSHHGS